MKIKVSPSLLSCDFLNLGDEIKRAQTSGSDMIHFDVMDGAFVNNISFGIPILMAAKKAATIPLDVHLMINEPIRYVKAFAEAEKRVADSPYEWKLPLCPEDIREKAEKENFS